MKTVRNHHEDIFDNFSPRERRLVGPITAATVFVVPTVFFVIDAVVLQRVCHRLREVHFEQLMADHVWVELLQI